MKKYVIAAALLGLSSLPTMAADLAARPMYTKAPMMEASSSWTGFYIGANGGYGWSNPSTTATYFGPLTGYGLPAIPEQAFNQKAAGALFGGQIGYNYQVATWLFGIEGDFDAASLNKSTAFLNADPLSGGGTTSYTQNARVDWLASIRGRVGYTFGDNLLYATGGAAWERRITNVTISANTSGGMYASATTGNISSTKSGWVAGAGYERMITPNWILRAEYLHYGFGGNGSTPVTVTCAALGADVCGLNVSTRRNDIDAVRLGVSYKFW